MIYVDAAAAEQHIALDQIDDDDDDQYGTPSTTESGIALTCRHFWLYSIAYFDRLDNGTIGVHFTMYLIASAALYVVRWSKRNLFLKLCFRPGVKALKFANLLRGLL